MKNNSDLASCAKYSGGMNGVLGKEIGPMMNVCVYISIFIVFLEFTSLYFTPG